MFIKVLGIVLLAGAAQANSGMGYVTDKCVLAANGTVQDATYGMDPDGASLFFDANGATQILRPENIVSRSNKEGLETIVYKTKQIKMIAGSGKPEFETVQRVIHVKRQDGKIISVKKEFDLTEQRKMRDLAKKSGWNYPVTKAAETSFERNGSDCDIKQSLMYQMPDDTKVEAKVTYDKDFCAKIEPMMKQIGSQNASQCVGLISSAQMAFEQRKKELAKEGKSFVTFEWEGKPKQEIGGSMDVSGFITACAMGGQMVPGMGVSFGMGMMVSGGSMMGQAGAMMTGGPSIPAPKEKKSNGTK
ncbi:hypothetical protein [Bdellovibrio sp. ArHS]|uniref:hypothetical protein n=1 Tax=Bdellovibrio sp. ArHS TaxID=1569284 RepID=UPI000A9D65AC|nr:hypothetical protein [Bdellovibrio sp. ArHS]